MSRCFDVEGTESDYEKAVYWLNSAAEQKNADAKNLLGDCYEFGWGVEVDTEKEDEYHKIAVENGYEGK